MQAQIPRFQTMETAVEAIRARGLTPATVGPFIVGVADPAALANPARLAQYIRDNAGSANVVLYTSGRGGSYNQVAARDEVLSRASRMESEQMAIRSLAAPERGTSVLQAVPRATEQRLRSLSFEFSLDDGRLNTISNAVNRNLEQIISPGSAPDVQRLFRFEGLLERYGFRKLGHISISIDLEAVRAAGFAVDEAAVERDIRANPGAVLSHFMNLGVPGAIRITQSEGTAWSDRPAGAPLTIPEFAEFVGMVDAARRFAEGLEPGSAPLAPARLTGRAER